MDAGAGDGATTDAPFSLLTCAFCLYTGPRGKRDRYFSSDGRSLHPSVPQSVLEDDAPAPIVCTPCYNFLHRAYSRQRGGDRRDSAEAHNQELSYRELKRRYPNVYSGNNNNNLTHDRSMYMLLAAKQFSKNAKIAPEASVTSFSLKNIPFTSERAFSFDRSKLFFGVPATASADGAEGVVKQEEERPASYTAHNAADVPPREDITAATERQEELVAEAATADDNDVEQEVQSPTLQAPRSQSGKARKPRQPWPTTLFIKNCTSDIDPQGRKRSRLSWCDRKQPCLYCVNHIDAVLSGQTRGTRRKSCVAMPPNWHKLRDAARETNPPPTAVEGAWEMAPVTVAEKAPAPLPPQPPQAPYSPAPASFVPEYPLYPLLDLARLRETVPPELLQLLPPQLPMEEVGETAVPIPESAVDQGASHDPANDAVVEQQLGGEEDSVVIDLQAADGSDQPAKRRRLRRGHWENGKGDEAEESDEPAEDVVEKASEDGEQRKGEEEEAATAEPEVKVEKVQRKRLRGLSKELRSLQLWSHWTEDEEEEEEEEQRDKQSKKERDDEDGKDEKGDDGGSSTDVAEPTPSRIRRAKRRSRSAKTDDDAEGRSGVPRKSKDKKAVAKDSGDDENDEKKKKKKTKKKKKREKESESEEKKKREKEKDKTKGDIKKKEKKEKRMGEGESKRSLRSREERGKVKLEREARSRSQEDVRYGKRKAEKDRRERTKRERENKAKEDEEDSVGERQRKEEQERRRNKKRKRSSSNEGSQKVQPPPAKGGQPKEEDSAVEALLSLIAENAAPKTPTTLPVMTGAEEKKQSQIDLAKERSSGGLKRAAVDRPRFEEIVLDDEDEEDYNRKENSRAKQRAKHASAAAEPQPQQPQQPGQTTTPPLLPPATIHLPSIASFLLGGAYPPSARSPAASAPPTAPSASPQPSPGALHRATAQGAGYQQSYPVAQPGPSQAHQTSTQYGSYPYRVPYMSPAGTRATPEQAYAAQVAAAHMAQLNPHLLAQLLQQSLLYPSAAAAVGGQAAATHAAQTLLYTPMLNLPLGTQFLPLPTSGDTRGFSSTPQGGPSAPARTPAAPPKSWPQNKQHH